MNALAALAAARHVGVSAKEGIEALSRFSECEGACRCAAAPAG